MLKENSVILFQGDSITDAGRTMAPPYPEYGYGYPLKVKQYLDTFYKDKNITVYNRGISGNRVKDLQERWQKDCIDLKPDYLSVLIGVNDTWRRYDSNDETTALEYEQIYRDILTKAKKELNCEIIILEPFLIHINDELPTWREDLDPKIQVARKIAKEFNATYIPLDGIFAAESMKINPIYWSEDGVHPTDAGHSLIARKWIEALL